MGKNVNGKPNGCVTSSSECVIWNGPDIPFLNLCTGDTISTVVAGIADKVCNLITITSVGSYDFACIDTEGCSPKSFIELFQLTLDTVCGLAHPAPGTTSTTVGSTTGCPDCEMAIAACFQLNGNTTMQLKEYIAAIGVKVCAQQVQIQTQALSLVKMQQDMAEMKANIDQLLQG